jgi:hypothetical protein
MERARSAGDATGQVEGEEENREQRTENREQRTENLARTLRSA